MNSVYAVCIIAVMIHIFGIPALIWAVRTRQGRESDQEAFRSIQSSRAGAALERHKQGSRIITQRGHSPLQLRLFLTMIVVMLVLMAAAQIYLAFVATHIPSAMQTAAND